MEQRFDTKLELVPIEVNGEALIDFSESSIGALDTCTPRMAKREDNGEKPEMSFPVVIVLCDTLSADLNVIKKSFWLE